MFQRFWHRMFGHKWAENVVRVPDGARDGVDIWCFLRRCSCGASQSAQVMGNLQDIARFDIAGQKGNDELQQLRKMAGIG